MYMVCHASKTWCVLQKKHQSPLQPKLQVTSPHGSKAIFSGMDLESLRLEEAGEYHLGSFITTLIYIIHRKVNELSCLLLSFNHWFDGMALLHQFHIEDGKVTYMSRFLNSGCYKENMEHNRIVVSEFGTIAVPDPCKNFFQRFLSRFELPSKCDGHLLVQLT